MFELFKVLKVRSKSRVLYPCSSTPFSGTGNNSQGFLGVWGAKGTRSFVHAQGSIHTHIHALCFKDLPHNIRRLPMSKEIQKFLTNALMQTPGIHHDPDMNCLKWLWDGGGKKVVLALNLHYPSIALERRNTKSVLSHSIKQGTGYIHPHSLSQQLPAFVSLHIHITLGICSSTEGHLQPEWK